MVQEDRGDELHYGMDEVWCDLSTSGEDHLDARVAFALTIPPREIADWILQNCQMLMVRHGQMMPVESVQGKYLLLFEGTHVLKDPIDMVIHTILHEAAHAFLGHGQDRLRSKEVGEEEERQANRLVAQWMRAVQYHKHWGEKKLSGRI